MQENRYITLDGLRGIAALAVVVFHIPELFGIPKQQSFALAVDLFFILSGFVVEHAYGHKLLTGMSFAQFAKVRLVRLYPLYIVGVASYAVFFVARPHIDPAGMVPAVLLSLLYLPTPPAISFAPEFAFPVNPVSWSLFCELAVNALYALWLVRLPVRSLIASIAGFGLMLILEKEYFESVVEWCGPWFIIADGLPRALFSFFAGVLLNRLAPRREFSGSAIAALALVAVLSFTFVGDRQQTYEILVIVLCFPVLTLLAAMTRAGILKQAYSVLGTISYPAYVMHMPIVLWVSALYPRVAGRQLDTIAPWGGLAVVTLIGLVAYLLERTYDQPVRNWLRQRSKRKQIAYLTTDH
jgi:peptidoglycan/LPS O-acetylase OafA/YrhL